MKYTSIFEKITCLSKLVSGSIIYPVFLVVVLLLVGLFFVKKIKNKKIIVLMIVSYLILFIITIFNNYEALGKVFDSISTNLFTNIYFPSTYTYLFVLLVVDIVTVTSLLNVKTEKIYRVVNGICFFVMQFILVLIMEVVAKGEVDIFSKNSLFSNSNLVVLLESSVGIFILWLITLMIIYLSAKITERIVIRNTDKELESASINLTNVLEIEVPNNSELEKEYNQDGYQTTNDIVVNSVVQDNYNLNDAIDQDVVSIVQEVQTNNIEEEQVDSTLLFDRLLNNGLPVIKENKNVDYVGMVAEQEKNTIKDEVIESIKEESVVLVKEDVENVVTEEVKEQSSEESVRDSYTLNDYRIFNKILNDIKEFNGSNVMEIGSYLELRLKAKYTAEKYYLFKEMLNNES